MNVKLAATKGKWHLKLNHYKSCKKRTGKGNISWQRDLKRRARLHTYAGLGRVGQYGKPFFFESQFDRFDITWRQSKKVGAFGAFLCGHSNVDNIAAVVMNNADRLV